MPRRPRAATVVAGTNAATTARTSDEAIDAQHERAQLGGRTTEDSDLPFRRGGRIRPAADESRGLHDRELPVAGPRSRGCTNRRGGRLRYPDKISSHSLSAEELRTVVAEAGVMVPRRHQRMLLSILDLDAITVDDVMVPRQEVVGLDLDRAWEDNLGDHPDSHHDRLPVYREDIDNIVGVTRVRDLLPELVRGELTQAILLERIREPYFVPEGTPLNKALLNFQQHRRRSAFVVDEYGDVQGLITTQDILREIVGELDSVRGRHRRDERERPQLRRRRERERAPAESRDELEPAH